MHWGGRRPSVISGNLPGHSRGMPVACHGMGTMVAATAVRRGLDGGFEPVTCYGAVLRTSAMWSSITWASPWRITASGSGFVSCTCVKKEASWAHSGQADANLVAN